MYHHPITRILPLLVFFLSNSLFTPCNPLSTSPLISLALLTPGRPARKLFRFSFVEGKIYLTWKGKFGNQGVDLGEVSHVSMGIGTDVLKKALAMTPQSITSADHYLSVVRRNDVLIVIY